MSGLRLEVSRSTEIDRWIAERHYLKSVPAGARLRLWVIDDVGNRIGAMMWGRPTARSLDQHKILELTRLYMVDDTTHCAESRALSMARKHIRKHLPEIKGLIAYSSIGVGHEGTIYSADGWFAIGKTRKRKAGWTSRVGREDRDLSQKIKWVRSP